MKVIINADDLGYSPDTNRSIFSLIDHRKITSTTLLANGPAFKDAVKHIPDYRDISFGVHLNISEFPSLTRAQVLYDKKLIDEKGVFTGGLHRFHADQAVKGAILHEWEQQVERVLDSGIHISHLDSHHHTHTLPWLFISLKKLQKKFDIRKVRGTLNWYNREYQPPFGLRLRKKVWRWALCSCFRTKTTDYLTNFDWFIANLENGGKSVRGTVELMCHPGHPYYPGQQYSVDEKKLLWSDWIQNSPCDIEPISYHQL